MQRLRAAVPAPGEALPRFELAAGVLLRLGQPLPAATARDVFALLAKATPGYEGLDYRTISDQGAPLASGSGVSSGEARA